MIAKRFGEGVFLVQFAEAVDLETAKSKISPKGWIAAFNGHKFEVLPFTLYKHTSEDEATRWFVSIEQGEHPWERVMVAYYPVDPRIERVDVHGAVRAYPNGDNTGWLFEHVNEGQHHDHFLRAEDCAIARFQSAVNKADIKEREAPPGATKTQALNRYKNLVAFRDAVASTVVEAEKQEHLGHFAQTDPEVGHVHDAVRSAIAAAKLAWAGSRDTLAKYSDIAAIVRPIVQSLTNPHKPETRWGKQARLEAERKAKEAEAEAEEGQ